MALAVGPMWVLVLGLVVVVVVVVVRGSVVVVMVVGSWSGCRCESERGESGGCDVAWLFDDDCLAADGAEAEAHFGVGFCFCGFSVGGVVSCSGCWGVEEEKWCRGRRETGDWRLETGDWLCVCMGCSYRRQVVVSLSHWRMNVFCSQHHRERPTIIYDTTSGNSTPPSPMTQTFQPIRLPVSEGCVREERDTYPTGRGFPRFLLVVLHEDIGLTGSEPYQASRPSWSVFADATAANADTRRGGYGQGSLGYSRYERIVRISRVV